MKEKTDETDKAERERKVNFAKRFKSIRKDMPKPTRIIHPKKMYDRRDKSWMNDNNETY